MADPAKVTELVEILGTRADTSEAAALLLAADGNLELAISMFFSPEERALYTPPLALPASNTADEAGPSNLGLSIGHTLPDLLSSAETADPLGNADSLDREGPTEERAGSRDDSRRRFEDKVAMLRELVGPGVDHTSLVKKLRKAKGCVNAAANTHFAQVQGLQKRREMKLSQASNNQRGFAPSSTDVVMEAAESIGGAEVGGSTTRGPGINKRPFSLSEDPPRESMRLSRRMPDRKRLRSLRDPIPEPILQTTVVISQEEFAYHSQSRLDFMLPLMQYRTSDGHLCAPLPETGFADYKVTPSRELDFSGPGLHLGSFTLSADSVQGLVIGGEDAFLDLSWDSRSGGSFQTGVTFQAPNGAFSANKHFVTRLGRCREERDFAGIPACVEEALCKLHSEDFVRLFVTMDSCNELVSDWKARQKAESSRCFVHRMHGTDRRVVREDITERPAGITPVRLSVPLQESAGKKVFNLHVCLTEKAFQFDAEIATNTGLAKHARAFGKSRTGAKALADVTEALLRHGGGLTLGPDSDGLLNQNPGAADDLGDTLPADLPGILDSIALPSSFLEADSPGGLITEPKRYQLQGLAWMMAREGADKGDLEGRREAGMVCSIADGSDRLRTASLAEKRTVDKSADQVSTDENGGTVSEAMALATRARAEEVEARGGASNEMQTAGACCANVGESLSTGLGSVGKAGLAAQTEKAGQEWGAASRMQPGAGGGVSRNELFLHPCWQQLLTADGQVMYMQREGGTCSPNFYVAPGQGTCGGLLCDEMGLGKTLEVLMLALAHPPPEGWAVADSHSDSPGGSILPVKATLVVVPASLLDQWKEETKRHVAPGGLELLHYRGIKGAARRRLEEKGTGGGPSWDFEKYDVIVTSYEVVRNEMSSVQPTPLRQYGFWRLVLDEAQVVANSASRGARTVANIVRRHAWVVTGTPITSRLDELESLLDLLGEPFGDPMVFRTMLRSPFEAREERGLRRLQALLRSIMLRRTKEGVAHELGLPPCAVEDRLLTFSPPEATFYRRMHNDLATALRRLDRLETSQKLRDERLVDGFDAKNLGMKAGGNALAALNRLRQACCHPQIVKNGGMSLGRARLSMPQIMGRLAARASADTVLAAKDWLASRVTLATERVHSQGESGADAFEPLLADIAAHVTVAADVSASGSEGSPEWERKGQRTVVKNLYCRLEWAALQAYKEAIRTSETDGDNKSRLVSVETRITELEHELGTTAEKLARLANGRELWEGPDAEKKRKRQEKAPERRLLEAEAEVQKAKVAMEAAQGQENHLRFKLRSTINGKGKAAETGDLTTGIADVIQEDKTVCPVCLDSCQACVAVTVCGHVFCGDCIRDLIDRGGAPGAQCPLCRHMLQQKDVFDVADQEEVPDFKGEYGTKISAVLAELREGDPRAKSVIFSSWRPLLALLGEALKEGNFRFATLWGSEETRAHALSEFADDPDVRTLLVTMGAREGAAGLNLTAASTVFILEPSFHPVLEAQAASRIHRLGQLQPTRVVRFLVDATVEPRIAALAASRLAKGKQRSKQTVFTELLGADLLQLVETRSPAGLES